jgi:exosome complex exonuclease DIS3/RRP44
LIRCSCRLMSQGTVNTQSLGRPILLVGREAINRSVQGDVVVVELLPESQWKAPGEEVIDQDCTCLGELTDKEWH